MEDITSLLKKAFGDEAISLIGIRNPRGADRYECPGCRASEDAEGYCSSTAPLMSIKHRPDCVLVRLHEMAHQSMEEGILSSRSHTCLVDIATIRPTKIIADSAPIQWGNSFWRIWYAYYEGQWYHTGDRTAAGTLTINKSSPVNESELQQTMARFKLVEIELPQ